MGFDKRKSPRRAVHLQAMIARSDSSFLALCKTIDMSASGARLEPKQQVEIPDEFLLVLSRDGRLVRRCKTVWRSRGQVGVRFLPDKNLARVREIALEQPY
jgi:hypothetical protein